MPHLTFEYLLHLATETLEHRFLVDEARHERLAGKLGDDLADHQAGNTYVRFQLGVGFQGIATTDHTHIALHNARNAADQGKKVDLRGGQTPFGQIRVTGDIVGAVARVQLCPVDIVSTRIPRRRSRIGRTKGRPLQAGHGVARDGRLPAGLKVEGDRAAVGRHITAGRADGVKVQATQRLLLGIHQQRLDALVRLPGWGKDIVENAFGLGHRCGDQRLIVGGIARLFHAQYIRHGPTLDGGDIAVGGAVEAAYDLIQGDVAPCVAVLVATTEEGIVQPV